jgi:hypothetical protein
VAKSVFEVVLAIRGCDPEIALGEPEARRRYA